MVHVAFQHGFGREVLDGDAVHEQHAHVIV